MKILLKNPEMRWNIYDHEDTDNTGNYDHFTPIGRGSGAWGTNYRQVIQANFKIDITNPNSIVPQEYYHTDYVKDIFSRIRIVNGTVNRHPLRDDMNHDND